MQTSTLIVLAVLGLTFFFFFVKDSVPPLKASLFTLAFRWPFSPFLLLESHHGKLKSYDPVFLWAVFVMLQRQTSQRLWGEAKKTKRLKLCCHKTWCLISVRSSISSITISPLIVQLIMMKFLVQGQRSTLCCTPLWTACSRNGMRSAA